MKYTFVTTNLESQIKEICIKIRLSMNGIVSEQMVSKGIVYKKNYGVSIPRIKEIASVYVPNQDLADRLWFLQIRETMILASLLQPKEQFSKRMAYQWMMHLNHTEIVEQVVMNLFSKLDFAPQFCLELVASENLWYKITALHLSARIGKKLSNDDIYLLLKTIKGIDVISEYHLYKSIGLSLSRLCRNNREIATYVLKEIDTLENTTSVAQEYISSEVKQEMLFLEIL